MQENKIQLKDLIGVDPKEDTVLAGAVNQFVAARLSLMPKRLGQRLIQDGRFVPYFDSGDVEFSTAEREYTDYEEVYEGGCIIEKPVTGHYSITRVKYRGENIGFFDESDGFSNVTEFMEDYRSFRGKYRSISPFTQQRFWVVSTRTKLLPFAGPDGADLPMFFCKADTYVLITHRQGESMYDTALRILVAMREAQGKPIPTRHGEIYITNKGA